MYRMYCTLFDTCVHFVFILVMASKNSIVNLNKVEKLDGVNFYIWRCKIQYLLNDQGVLDTLTIHKAQSKDGVTLQKCRQMQSL